MARSVELAEQIDTELRVLEAQRALSGDVVPNIETELDRQKLEEDLDAILGTTTMNH